MHEELIKEIEFQISEIERLFEEYDIFFKHMNYEEPDITQITVIASIMHSFYTGIEKIFEKLSKDVDGFVPTGNKSHQELLDNMHVKNNGREKIINEDVYLLLNEYMKFRHVYRHGYSYQLKWGKMKPLANNLFNTWKELKEQLIAFLNSF